MCTAKVTAIGENIEITVPSAALGHLKLSSGDELQVEETADGLKLTQGEDDLAQQIEVAREVMTEDYEVLRKLAQ